MKLAHLSVISILGCLLGLFFLIAYGLFSFQEMQHRQQEVSEMLLLQQRLNTFSVASDSMLLYEPDPDLWRAYVADARTLESKLLDLASEYPDTHKTVNNIRQILEMVERVVQSGVIGAHAGSGEGPLAIPERSRLVINQVAMNGIAMDTALSDALHERKTSIAQAGRQIVLQLAVVGVLFGALCVIAFVLIHRRITRPVMALVRTIGHLRSGDNIVRAPVSGDDELTHLAHSFNHLMDQLQARENSLLQMKYRYERAESVGNLGSCEVDYDTGNLSWSPGVFNILGLNPEKYEASESVFFERIHPGDRDWFTRRRAQWLEGPDPDFSEEHRILRPDNSVRWVRETAWMFYHPNRKRDYSTTIIQDITDRKVQEQKLVKLSVQLQQVLNTIAEGMLVIGHDLRHQFSNATAANLLGETQASLQQDPVGAMVRNLGGPAWELLQRGSADGTPASSELFQKATNRWLEVRVYPGGEQLTLFIRDVSQKHLAAADLERTLELRKALINALPAHIALIDERGIICDVNEQWRHFAQDNAYPGEGFGLGANYLKVCDTARGDCAEEAAEVADGLRDVLAGKRGIFVIEYPCHSPHEERWFRVMVNRVEQSKNGGPPTGAVVMHVDITARKQAERKLESLAFNDTLTSLLNRPGFERKLNRMLEEDWQPDAMVVLLDIVGQRNINDTFGYATGDAVLVEVGRRLLEQTEDRAILCRVGGDEFALFLPTGTGVPPDAQRQSVEQVFHRKLVTEGHVIAVRARCGYTILGSERRSLDALLAEAELALFRSPKGESFHDVSWSLYSYRFGAQLRIREDLIQELRRATDEGAFELHFQPKVRLADGSLIAAEALLRWPHPRLGLQSPGLFIPLAEQSQLIGPIGEWVLHEACRRLGDWQRQGLDIVRIAVNVSLQQFMIGDIVATVQRALEENGLSPSALSLEITESVFGGESDDLRQKLLQLHEMGVRLSLDDFGTGYSSLLYLQRYPFDEIKIDRAFVSRVLTDRYCRQVIQSVVNLATVLDAEVVAEGIESREIGAALHALGCEIGQGFYYSLPLEAEDFRWLLERQAPLPLTSSRQQ